MWWISIVVAFALAVWLVAYAVFSTGARADRQAHRLHQMALEDDACIVCGEPTFYRSNGKPVHPQCREKVVG